MKKLFLIAYTLFLFGCETEILEKPRERCRGYNGTSDLETLWQIPYDNDTIACNTGHPIIYEDLVIYLHQLVCDPVIIAHDVKTGEVAWERRDLPDMQIGVGERYRTIINGALVIASWKDTYVLDARTGKTLNHVAIENMGPRMSVFKENTF